MIFFYICIYVPIFLLVTHFFSSSVLEIYIEGFRIVSTESLVRDSKNMEDIISS